MTLQVTGSQNIPATVFVLRRFKTTSKTNNDVFAAIASPEQLESLGVNAPYANTSFFLASEVSLVATTVEGLNDILQEILRELEDLCTDYELLQNQTTQISFNISASGVTANSA